MRRYNSGQSLSALILPMLFLIGLAVILYPSVSDRWNRYTQSRAIVDYTSNVKTMDPSDHSGLFSAAETYNRALRELRFPLMYADRIDGYEQQLSVSGTDVMGYIAIPKINVELPIYHGTSDAVLNVGVGHLQGTSLPIGGEDTHAVLSAHCGLPSAKLFTDLDRLQTGDIFELSILGQTLRYRVEASLVVLPEEVDALYVQQGRDLCTLMTCTPYGINTHRLLVRGVRETADTAPMRTEAVPNLAAAEQVAAPIVGLCLALPVFLFGLLAAAAIRGVRTLTSKGGADGVIP